MPDAWGADEFIAPPGEWSRSGANGGNQNYNNAAIPLNTQDLLDSSTTFQQNGMPVVPILNQPPENAQTASVPETQGSANF